MPRTTITFLLYVLRTTYSMSEGRRKTGRQGTPSQHASETERTICHSLSSCCGVCCWFVGLFVTFDSGHILPVEYLASQPCWRRLSRTWAVHWSEGTTAQHALHRFSLHTHNITRGAALEREFEELSLPPTSTESIYSTVQYYTPKPPGDCLLKMEAA